MNEEFSRLLLQTEDKWRSALYNYVKKTFASDPLPSHNEDHHLRVWNYCKGLLSELSSRGIIIDKLFLEEMIVAIFFHDTGMSINRDTDHGKESRRLCEEWIGHNNFPRDRESDKMLDAIEHHDDKSYLLPVGLTTGNQVNMLSVLNVCDDMDAFSYCGIYRYCEIYIMRGISLDELGQQVISNASRRYGNFVTHCMQLPGMIKTHAPRYDILESFFRQYNAQLRKDPGGKSINHGPVHIVKIFYRQIMGGVNSVESLCSAAINGHEGIYEKTFFENLRREWCDPTPALPKGEGVHTVHVPANPGEGVHTVHVPANPGGGVHTVHVPANPGEGVHAVHVPANPGEEAHTVHVPANPGEREHMVYAPINTGEGARPGYITANPRAYKLIKEFRDKIKKNPTKAESVLWEFLRKKKTGHNIRRQHVIDHYIADFVCLPLKVIIEVDGEIHDFQKENDEMRTLRLKELGFDVIRFTNDEVLIFPIKVAGEIRNYLENKKDQTSTNLFKKRE